MNVKDDFENNNFRDTTQQITKNSYQFFDYEAYVASADTSKTYLKFYYRERYDQRADSLRLRPVAKATTIGGQVSLKKLKDYL